MSLLPLSWLRANPPTFKEMRIRLHYLMNAIILEQSVELAALLQPSIENTISQRPQPQLLRARPWHHGTDLFLYLQVTHVRQHQDGRLLCVFRTLGPFAVQPPRNSCDCLQCDHTCPSVLVKGHPCTTTQPCLPGAGSIGQYFSSSKGLYLSRILRTLESSQRSSWALSSSSGNY